MTDSLASIGCVPASDHYVTATGATAAQIQAAHANAALIRNYVANQHTVDLFIPPGVWPIAIPPGAAQGDAFLPFSNLKALTLRGVPGGGSTWNGDGLHGSWLVPIADGCPPNAVVLDARHTYKVHLSGFSVFGNYVNDLAIGLRLEGTAGDRSDLSRVSQVNLSGEFAAGVSLTNCGQVIFELCDIYSSSDEAGRVTGTAAVVMAGCSGIQFTNCHAFTFTPHPGNDGVILDGCGQITWDGGHLTAAHAAFSFRTNPSTQVTLRNLLLSAGTAAIALDTPGVYSDLVVENMNALGQTAGAFLLSGYDGVGLERLMLRGVLLPPTTPLASLAGAPPAGWTSPFRTSTIYTGGRLVQIGSPAVARIDWDSRILGDGTATPPVTGTHAAFTNYAERY
jgi:hypothetical protein